MGTGFESWAAFHAVEGNNKTLIDHLHYDVIRAKPDGSCSRPRRLDLVCRESPRESLRVRNAIKTTSLAEEGVLGASFNLNYPKTVHCD